METSHTKENRHMTTAMPIQNIFLQTGSCLYRYWISNLERCGLVAGNILQRSLHRKFTREFIFQAALGRNGEAYPSKLKLKNHSPKSRTGKTQTKSVPACITEKVEWIYRNLKCAGDTQSVWLTSIQGGSFVTAYSNFCAKKWSLGHPIICQPVRRGTGNLIRWITANMRAAST